MLIHAILFFGIISLYFLMCFRKKSTKRELLFLRFVFFIFFMLIATREMTVGSDTPMYVDLFEKCAHKKWSIVQFGGYFEPGYLALNVLISYLSSNPRFFVAVMGFIFCLAFYKYIKNNSKNYLLSCLIFVGLLFFYTSMTMLRQLTAVAIILAGIGFAKDKKLIKFLGIVAIASLFHSSAWVAIVLYPLLNMRYTRKRVLIIILTSVILAMMIGLVSSGYMDLIGRTNFYESRAGNTSLGNIIVAIIYFIFYAFGRIIIGRKKPIKDFDAIDSQYLYTLLGASMMSAIGAKMDVMSRTVIYFSVFTLSSIPNIIECYVINLRKKLAYCSASMLFLLCYSSWIIINKPEWNTAFDYRSCLSSENINTCLGIDE